MLAAVRVTDEEEVLAAAEEQASAGAKQHSATSPGHASCADSLRLTTPAGGGGAGAHCCEHSDLAPGQLISYPFCLEEAPAAGFTARQSDGEAESGAAQPAPEEEPAEPPSPGQLQREQQTLEAAGDLAVALTFGYCRRRVLDDVRSMVEHALSKAAASEDSPSLRDAPPRPTCWVRPQRPPAPALLPSAPAALLALTLRCAYFCLCLVQGEEDEGGNSIWS